MKAFQLVFSQKASPFVRWCLSPFLVLFGAVFTNPLRESLAAGNHLAAIVTALLVILCVAGFLALWGVPFVGRLVSGIIALAFGWYLVEECFISFDGDWRVGGKRSQTSPINSILGFVVFGVPCLIYTVFGRFTARKEVEFEDEIHDPDDDEPDQRTSDGDPENDDSR